MMEIIKADQTVIESLQQRIAEKDVTILNLQTELNSTLNINAELSNIIDEMSKKKPLPVESQFEVDGITYGFNYHRMVYKGLVFTHEDVMQNPQMQQNLINCKSGMIKLIQ